MENPDKIARHPKLSKYFFINKIGIVLILFASTAFAFSYTMNIDMSSLPVMSIISISGGLTSLGMLTILCLAHAMDRSPTSRSSMLFYFMIVLVYLGVLTNNITYIINGVPELKIQHFIIALISYLIFPLLGPAFWDYQNIFFADNSRTSKITRIFLIVMMIIDIAFIAITASNGSLFVIDENGVFQRGAMDKYIYIFPVFIMVMCFVENIRRKLPPRKRASLLAFSIAPTFTTIITFYYPHDVYTYIIASLILLLIYGTIQMERSVELAEKSHQLTERQTQIMVSQIQPHFMYNTLSVIDYLCGKDVELARSTINDFSGYLRTNMESIQSNKLVSFEKELEHTRTYLNIEKLRFGDILNIEYDIQYSDFQLPPITLQPLVENAIKHGIRGKENGGTVRISTKKESRKIIITVEDDGIGFDPNTYNQDGKTHIGIDNARNRLKLQCDGKLSIDSKIGAGTKVSIILEEQNESIVS